MTDFPFISLPLIVSFVVFSLLVFAFRRLPVRDKLIAFSFYTSIPHIGLAALAVWFTLQNPISSEACLLGIFGFFGSLMLLVVDIVNLGISAVRAWRNEPDWSPKAYALYVVVRLLLHGVLAFAFMWCLSLCTV